MSVSLRWSVGIFVSLAAWQLAMFARPHEACAVSVTTSTYAIDCGPMMPANPDIKGPMTIVSATSAVSAIQSNTSRAHAQAAATSKIVGGVVIKSVTGTSWVDATLPNYDTKGASWSASASGTTLIVEPQPGMPQGMVDFQFITPQASALTLEELGYNFSTPGYQPPTLQSIKRDQLPAGFPGSSFFDISVNTLVSVHQDGDGVNPPVDFTFLDGGFIFRSSGQVTPIGTLRPDIAPNQGGTTGIVDFSFLPMASPVFQIRSGVPFELTTQISIGMQSDFPIGMGLAFPGISTPVGGGTSFATNFAKVNDPGGLFTLFAIDPSVSHWTGGSGSWTSTTNWEFPTNGVDGVADFSTQNITNDTTITLDGDFTAGKILFGDTSPSHHWTVAPGAPAGSLTLKALTGAPTIDVANPTVGPPMNSTGGSVGFVNQLATISAPIAGTGGLTKTGSGTLVLAAQNTYSGPTNVKLGGLTLDFSNAGAPATNIIDANSNLTLGGGAVVSPTQPAGAALTVNGGATTNLQTFSSTHLNDGFHAIRVNESPTGNVTLNLGPLTRSAGGAVMFSLPTNGQITTTTPNANGILGGWATVLTTTTGPATATVDWATVDVAGKILPYTSYTPLDFSVQPSQIPALPGANVVIDSNATTTINAIGSPLDINSIALKTTTAGRTVQVNGVLRFGAAGGILKSNALNTSGIFLQGGTLTAGGAPDAPGDLYLVANGNNTSTDQIVLNSNVADNGTGAVRLIKTGTAAVALRSLNSTYSGGTLVESGRLSVSNGSAAGSGDISVLNGAQFSASFDVGPAQTIQNNLFIAGNGLADQPTGPSNGALRFMNNANFNGTITLLGDSRISAPGSSFSTSTATLNGRLTGNFNLELGGGNAAPNKNFVLTNTLNDYGGHTTITSANVKLGANNVIPHGLGKGNVFMQVQVSGPTALPAVLDLQNNSATINGLSSSAPSAMVPSVVVTGSGGTLTVGDNNASGSFYGTIGGSLSLTKIGAGTQTLGGANTYTGATTIAAGTLALAHANGLSAGSPVTLQAGATLATGGFNQTLGSFSPAGGSILDLGTAASVFNFDSAPPWTGTFMIKNWDGLLAGGGIDRVTVGFDALATLDLLQMTLPLAIQFENFDPGFQTIVNGNGQIEVLPNGLPYRKADFTRDNQITGADLKPMLAALTDLDAFALAQNLSPQQLIAMGDFNGDFAVNNLDLQPMLNFIATSDAGSLAPVPEPSTILLATIGLIALAGLNVRRQKQAVC